MFPAPLSACPERGSDRPPRAEPFNWTPGDFTGATNYCGRMVGFIVRSACVSLRCTARLVASLTLALALGCQTDTESHRDASSVPSVETGTVEGVVRIVAEAIPESTRVRNTTDPELCGESQSLEDFLVSAVDGGVGNVIVALLDVPPDRIPARPAERLVLDNRDCRFVPHAAVLTVGSTIVATNSDAVLHTEHFYGAHSINMALPSKDVSIDTVVTEDGMVIVKCDIHGWMQAFIRVDAHPFHAVSDAAGVFRILDVPAGTYQLELWHEKLGQQRVPVEVEGGRTAIVEARFSP